MGMQEWPPQAQAELEKCLLRLLLSGFSVVGPCGGPTSEAWATVHVTPLL